jgi:hypothetical protein
MCLAGQVSPVPVPATAVGAATMAQAGLSWLAAADPAGLTTAELADCLRALERAESMHTAARARVLAAFTAQGGYQDDGQGSAKTWLRSQTRGHRRRGGRGGGLGTAASLASGGGPGSGGGGVVAVVGAAGLRVVGPAARRGTCGRGCDLAGRGGRRGGPAGPGRAGRGDPPPLRWARRRR